MGFGDNFFSSRSELVRQKSVICRAASGRIRRMNRIGKKEEVMKRLSLFATLAMLGVFAVSDTGKQAAGTDPAWNMNATIIEACSCPMFCQCYFNSKPAEHH